MPRLHLPIQNPCHEDWTAMASTGAAGRFCDVCTKQVHDVSAMTEDTARAVLATESAKGRVCVRYTLDHAGQIKFKAPTIEAPSVWRMTLAAAGLAMAVLSGCADAQPDRINADGCVYEVGVWGFTAARGEGTCPAVPEEPEELVMGEFEGIDPPPVIHEPEVKGEMKRPIEPTEPVMGKMAPIEPEPTVVDPHEIELQGDVAAIVDEPCDSPQPANKPANKPASPE